ncbi:type I restriction enzyme endonuclease domain-containing protein [Szabonella alba]|uniref:DUF3387 domain-containing protein n=1 Tax=Szabonella alba TaxID=2804194 RepID=A0A8K0VBQ4_9RHOB|nr:DUF3387 domain-containing protein [Szabonella alba]
MRKDRSIKPWDQTPRGTSRILRKYGYPPDLEDAAVRGVLAQAEAMLSELEG